MYMYMRTEVHVMCMLFAFYNIDCYTHICTLIVLNAALCVHCTLLHMYMYIHVHIVHVDGSCYIQIALCAST